MASKNLVIVESPAKARTIGPFLSKDFTVVSSYGHIRDLPKKGLGIDIEKSFEPTYEVSADKKKIVSELKKQAKGATVWLASDDDREGEAIAWHLCSVLGLDPKSTNRIVFHEITKPAIIAAMEQPRHVNGSLVDAQQARRILDRLVGYKLSPVLWKKVQTGLSAGRVQSVAVRLIVERERDIKKFEAESSFKVIGDFKAGDEELSAELNTRPKDEAQISEFLEAIKDSTYKVADIATKPSQRNPSPPFTTSSLQQEAARRLSFSVKQTMTLAQRLYENGHISYMRTDSTILSKTALQAAAEHIRKNFGEDYYQPRQYQTKNQSAQEAHEAIRPTTFIKTEAGDDANQKKLYKLIWQRALASQMSPARLQKTQISIDISGRSEQFVASGEVLEFAGFMKVYGGAKDDVLLPPLSVGQSLDAVKITADETFSRPPARYSEASLVKKLEEMGIGRPSTYAPTISTIQDRGYIEKKDLEGEDRTAKRFILKNKTITADPQQTTYGADRAKLMPTFLAEIVTDFLTKHFKEIVDYDFTAKAELEFDLIEEGKRKWQAVIDTFYKSFEPLLEESENVTRAETSQAKELGTHPKNGKVILARYGRYGPMLQMQDPKDEEAKPTFAPLPSGTTIETVTLEAALKMFELPRTVGKTDTGEEITANIGRFGPYVKVGSTFISIKGHDPLTITEAEAKEVIAAKQQEAASKIIKDFGTIKIQKGPYGPYITDGKKNARIAKDTDPESITEAQAKKLLKDAPARGKRRRVVRRKKTS